MPSENLYKRLLRLKYSIVVDGKDSKVSQSYPNIKLTSTVDELYNTAASMKTLINAPSVDIEKDDSFTLEE